MKIISELPLDGAPVHHVSGKDLCDLLDLSPAALSDLKKRGLAVHCGHDAYDLTETVRAYVLHLRGIASGWGSADQAANLTAERTRLAKEQADAQALKNAKLRDELVDAGEVERAWADILRQVRARILAVPSRLRSDLPDLDRPTLDAMDRALRDALTKAAHGHD
ncbi:terminase small subunit [Palleronia caenipelagi]|uniref:DNA packaging protein n=1 Tax=Palleronia caenipelagi TaxID=2489174 RepID=A0A547Q6S2_9RHOB|nr:terminase small subunit [Palleronia caenipelagi]TRD22087.1 DNA packaging protein [Palleronia caenipelagi]